MGCCCDKASYDIAGNRTREGQVEELHGFIRWRGRHIIKVFAQVLELVHVYGGEESENVVVTSIDDDDQFDWLWQPMCDVPVHVNLVCLQEGVIYEYAVSAEESEICPFSSSIIIPGTEIKKTGLYFVQWKDTYTGNVYGLNFFTEHEALRWLSSCFPPTFTPDSAIRTASSPPSYPCPPPPRPVSNLPFLSQISPSKDGPNDEEPLSHNHRSSTPERDAEEFFRLVIGPIQPLHAYTVKTKSSEQIETSLSMSSIDEHVATLPKSNSMGSDLDDEKPLSKGSFPSPPSQFDVSSKASEDSTDGEASSQPLPYKDEDPHEACSNLLDKGQNTVVDDNSVELYQTSDDPIEFNKILADIPEEDEELLDSSGSLQKLQKQLHRMDSIDSRLSHQLPESMSSVSLDSTVQDFDKLLQDLQESDLLEITRTQSGISRQASFAGPPPSLPLSLPPGPTLSNINEMEGDFDTPEFVNALKRLSIASLENVMIPDLPNTHPPGNLLSPRQSISDTNQRKDSQLPLPAQPYDEDTDPPLHRHPSFLQRQFNPPEEFSRDSGVANTSDTEGPSQEDAFVSHRHSQLLQALRIADLENKTRSSSPSTSLSENQEYHDNSGNWVMLSRPEMGRDTPASRAPPSAIKKSGWLEVKTVLVRKNKKVAMKSRRKWNKYWAILNGVNLLLYKWNSETTIIMDDTPCDTKLDIKGCLAYPVTNHMKRDHLFSLSTTSGNTYYMEAICQSATDEWVQELHTASALAITGQSTKEEALEELARQVSTTEESIQTERRMKNMAELQLPSVPGASNRQSVIRQIALCCEDMDRLNVELYRMKCYQASLRGEDLLPNQQSILGIVSKQTKTAVSKIGIFSVASLQSMMNTRYSNPVDTRSLTSRTSFRELSTDQQQNQNLTEKKKRIGFGLFSSSSSRIQSKPRRNLKGSSPIISSPVSASGGVGDPRLLTFRQLLEPDPLITGFGSVLTVEMQDGQTCEVPFKIDLTVGDVILNCCKKFSLDPSDHFLLLMEENMDSVDDAMIPNEDDFIHNLNFKYLSVRQKLIRAVYFKDSAEESGLKLKPDLHSLGTVTHALIGEVTPGSAVHSNGLIEGDEVVLINETAVSHMNWRMVMEEIKKVPLNITVRTCRLNAPHGVAGRTTHIHLKDLVCPSPPTRGKKLSPEKLDNLIVPKPSDLTKSCSYEQIDSESVTSSDDENEKEETDLAADESERVRQLIKSYSEVSKLVGIWKAYDEASFVIPDTDEVPGMTQQQKIIKCVQEIITTETEHVKMLEVLVDRFLEPLLQEKFFPKEKMAFITANIQSVVVQQKQFKGRIEVIPQVYSSEEPATIKALLQELCGSIEVHLDTFRQYSQFYAAQHELNQLFDEFQDKQRLEQFLEARNPNQDPNFTLKNLLSKPVLRLLRYPLFFKAIRDLLEKTAEESKLLDDTISSLFQVTGYINEVQRVAESYVDLFDELLEESKLAEFGVSVRISQLLTHTTVMWLNAKGPGMNKSWKKGKGPETNCFVFETVLVILCLAEKSSKRKISKASVKESMVTSSELLHSELLPLAQCKANNLPDSDGVTSMWQIVHKNRQANSRSNAYTFRCKSLHEKATILELLNLAISDQLAIYGGISGSKSPTMSSISAYGSSSPFKGERLRSNSLLSRLTKTDSVDSDYELTLL